MNNITFTTQTKVAGSTATRINVARNGAPFAQIWTFADAKHTWHPWHLKTLTGLYQTFGGGAYQTKKAKKVAGFDAMAFAQHLAQ